MYQKPSNLLNLPLEGRLKHFLTIWEQLTGDLWVLQVESGYLMEFTSTPIQLHPPNPVQTSLEHQVHIDQEVQELISKNAVHYISPSHSQEPGLISTLFAVHKKGGGLRPVINLKPLNQFIPYEHFKMESIFNAKGSFNKGYYMVEIDLKDEYLTVPIGEDHQKCIRFMRRELILEFSCLPFGLASAPRMFTKLLKPVWSTLRQRGIRLIAWTTSL